VSVLFPVAKLVATAFSTLSGLGGGILAPSLSIGAWTGVSLGKIVGFQGLRVCALLGMTAYFTGAFQIPITAIIVCMEMTNEHDVIFPMMISALCAFLVARIMMPVPLYHVLIERWSRRHDSGNTEECPKNAP
jgi:H+/Cl- antiporter ClcA